MPCIDDPCSNSEVIVGAMHALTAAQLQLQGAVGTEKAGRAVVVERALAYLEEVTAKCDDA